MNDIILKDLEEVVQISIKDIVLERLKFLSIKVDTLETMCDIYLCYSSHEIFDKINEIKLLLKEIISDLGGSKK